MSVILTSYNQDRYLAEAIGSVLRQTCRDFEIIAIDDGSTDGGLERLRSFQESYPECLRVCTHPGGENRGLVATYSLGIAHATGPLLAFLEGDDRWDPNFLAEKVRIFERFPEVGVVFSPCRFLLDGNYGLDMLLRQKVLQLFLPKDRPFDNLRYLLRKNNVATFSAFAARADLVRGVEGPRDPRLCFYDWWLLTQLSLRTKFFFDTHSEACWRQSRHSLMGRQVFDDHKQRLTAFVEEMYDSVEQQLPDRSGMQWNGFAKKKRGKDLFIDFYVDPGPCRFAEFFRVDPLWALESLVSYCINYSKFARR